MVIKKVRYSFFKKYFSDFEGFNYDSRRKTIEIEIPEINTKFPKNWEKTGNHYTTPDGIRIYFWDRGLETSYCVEYRRFSRNIYPGIYAKEIVIKAVQEATKEYFNKEM